jgi:type IV pilus assembly protein PilV
MQLSHAYEKRRSRFGSMRGVSLIEVLISILLSAIGLLALAGANVASIRYSKMAQYRGTATLLATDIAERMRANKAGLTGYAVALDFAAQGTAPAADTSCSGYAVPLCTPVNLAAYDLNNWRFLVRSQLPEGSVFITVQPIGVANAADLWLVWRDPAVASVASGEVNDQPTTALECPSGLNVDADASIRCSYFRINL